MNYSLTDIDQRISALLAQSKTEKFLADAYAEYELTNNFRKKYCVPVLGFYGHSRAGKNTAAEYLKTFFMAEIPVFKTKINSVSEAVAPLLADLAEVSEAMLLEQRHEQSEFWRVACIKLRAAGVNFTKLALANSHIVCGSRGKEEFRRDLESKAVDLAVWIENKNVLVDHTLEFSASDCHIIVENNGTIADFYRKLDALFSSIFLLPSKIFRSYRLALNYYSSR